MVGFGFSSWQFFTRKVLELVQIISCQSDIYLLHFSAKSIICILGVYQDSGVVWQIDKKETSFSFSLVCSEEWGILRQFGTIERL